MAYTYEWQVNTLERSLSDGFVEKLIFRVNGLDSGEQKFRETGEVTFTKPESLPSDFVAYDSLTSDVCIGWLKSTLGTDRVTEIETSIKKQMDLMATPVTETGKPWS